MSMEAKTGASVRVRNFNLRAYLAGGGATVALIAAAVLVFASLGAYVAFEGLPIGGDSDDGAEVAVEQSEVAASVRAGDRSGDDRTESDGSTAGGAQSGETGDPGLAGEGAGGVELGAPVAPAVPLDDGDGDLDPQPLAPAPGPSQIEPTGGQNGGAGPLPEPPAEVETTVGEVELPVPLPEEITEPLGGALDGAGAPGADLTAQLGSS